MFCRRLLVCRVLPLRSERQTQFLPLQMRRPYSDLTEPRSWAGSCIGGKSEALADAVLFQSGLYQDVSLERILCAA